MIWVLIALLIIGIGNTVLLALVFNALWLGHMETNQVLQIVKYQAGMDSIEIHPKKR
jgi:Tfp pilus assembly protein PilV